MLDSVAKDSYFQGMKRHARYPLIGRSSEAYERIPHAS